jgi:hypothetical protein
MMEGIPISIIQRQLGHASLATTDTYLSHIAPKHVIEAISGREWPIRNGGNTPTLSPIGESGFTEQVAYAQLTASSL